MGPVICEEQQLRRLRWWESDNCFISFTAFHSVNEDPGGSPPRVLVSCTSIARESLGPFDSGLHLYIAGFCFTMERLRLNTGQGRARGHGLGMDRTKLGGWDSSSYALELTCWEGTTTRRDGITLSSAGMARHSLFSTQRSESELERLRFFCFEAFPSS
jgi:hypothetical protein